MNHLVITGGSKGLGLDISKKFLEMGWRVTSGSRTEPSTHNEGKFWHEKTDVRDRNSVINLLDTAVSKFGKVNCFINNSGYSEWKSLSSISEEFLQDILQTNLMGYFWGSQAAARILESGDSIINISSLAARRGTANNSAYVASKFGVAGLTQSLSKELGSVGIRVNAVCPVLVKTEGLMDALNDKQAPAGGNPDAFLSNFAAGQTSLGFLPSGRDVANLCYFLAGPEARAITGQSISVDSGVFPN
jgi:3-oxoacyl-[acyl-carrier protein] reductase/meso-butanediol dehydrogenase/(S,S)-butanediol dehydrogenase/diacetyl reductase